MRKRSRNGCLFVNQKDNSVTGGTNIPYNILLVESEMLNRNSTILLLKRMGYNAIAINNGIDAIEWVFTQPDAFDLVLLNIHLPDISGLEVCRYMRTLPDACHIPILAFSTDETAAGQQEMRRSGINDFLAPFAKPSVLRASLRKWLKGIGKRKKGIPTL